MFKSGVNIYFLSMHKCVNSYMYKYIQFYFKVNNSQLSLRECILQSPPVRAFNWLFSACYFVEAFMYSVLLFLVIRYSLVP